MKNHDTAEPDQEGRHRIAPVFAVAFAVAVGSGWLAARVPAGSVVERPADLPEIVFPRAEPLAQPVRPERLATSAAYRLILRQEIGEQLTLLKVRVEEKSANGVVQRTFRHPELSIWNGSKVAAAGISTDVERLLDGAELEVTLSASGSPDREAVVTSESVQLNQLLEVLDAACSVAQPRFPVGDDLSSTDTWEWSQRGIRVATSVVGDREGALVLRLSLDGAVEGSGLVMWDLVRGVVARADLAWKAAGPPGSNVRLSIVDE